jgi:hemerythrin-like metal-binding protein
MIKDIRYVEWSDGFKVNIKVVDKQHKHFIGIMDKLFKTMQSNEKMAVPKIIDELVEYADLHFATEQKLFSKYKYPGADEHIAELIYLAERFGQAHGKEVTIKAPITHQDLADSINMSRETASRALELLIEEKLFEQRDHTFVICDISKLQMALN